VLDIERVLDEHEQHKFEASHAHEREKQQQIRRAKKLKEERRMLKEAAQAAAAVQLRADEDAAAGKQPLPPC
jgi:hypothetical protein